MVEVFKTNVQEPVSSQKIIGQLPEHFPYNKINFDLSDCDRILRIEGENICPKTIMQIMASNGHSCQPLS